MIKVEFLLKQRNYKSEGISHTEDVLKAIWKNSEFNNYVSSMPETLKIYDAFYIPEEGPVVWVNKDEFNKGHQFFVEGLATTELQVLKSAAGYYIGTLGKEFAIDESLEIEEEDKKFMWGPFTRDSEEYWEVKEEAELALLNNNYKVKI